MNTDSQHLQQVSEEFQRMVEEFFLVQSRYSAAIKEIQTKLEILDDEFQMRHRRNPIHHMQSRLKTIQSMLEKLKRKNYEVSINSAVKNLQDIAGMIPGMDAKALSGANVDEKAMGRIEAIIQSMTPGERDNPAILNSSRKKRIAAGAGTSVVEINKLLKQFELMQQLVRQMSGNSKAMKRMKRGGRGGFGGLGNLFGGGGRPYGF